MLLYRLHIIFAAAVCLCCANICWHLVIDAFPLHLLHQPMFLNVIYLVQVCPWHWRHKGGNILYSKIKWCLCQGLLELWKFVAINIKNFQKSKYWGLLREHACTRQQSPVSGGLFPPTRARSFLRQKKRPLTRKDLQTYRVTTDTPPPLN
jgi:hypothetical protein